MKLKMTRMQVWAAEIADEPGGLSRPLETIADYGTDLESVIAHRLSEKPGRGVVFVTPMKGQKLLANPTQAGFHPISSVTSLKIEGTNHPSVGARITRAISDVGVRMHGLSAAVLGRKFVCYIGFANAEDLVKAEKALAAISEQRWTLWGRPFAKKEEPSAKAA